MALELVSICRRFGRQRALEDVSIHVERGDCYGFLGHNGAGKTTAMRIALGLLRPRSGRVLVDGFDALRHPREARARMGGLIEVPGFHAGWPGARNLRVLAGLQGLRGRAARDEVSRLMELVGLADVGRKPVRAYSHGMRQRLGIAQALLGNPQYVLLDEPTNGLDPEGIAEMRALLVRLRSEGLTVLVSSHQLAELSGTCSRIGIIRNGRMLAEGTPDELGAGPHRYVIEFCAPGDLAKLGAAGLEARDIDGTRCAVELESLKPQEVLRDLVTEGAGVRSFSREERSLEALYLRTTRSGDGLLPADDIGPLAEWLLRASPVNWIVRERPSAGATQQALQPPAPRQRIAPRWPTLRILRYDLAQWMRRPAVWLLLASPAIIATARIVAREAEHRRFAAEVSGGGLASTTDVTGFEGLGLGLRAGLWLLSFLALGLGSLAIASERGQGTLRNLLLRPVRRWQVMAAKALSLLVALGVGYGLLVSASFLTSAWAFDFADVSEVLPNGELYPILEADVLWPEVAPLLRSPVLPLVAFLALGLLAGSICRRASTALATGLMCGALLHVARVPGRILDFERWLPSAYLPWPAADRSYVAYYLDLVTGAVNAEFRLADTAVTLPLFCAAACLVLATLFLVRRPVS